MRDAVRELRTAADGGVGSVSGVNETGLSTVTMIAEPGKVYWQLRCTHCGLALLLVHTEDFGGLRPRYCPGCAAAAVYFRIDVDAGPGEKE